MKKCVKVMLSSVHDLDALTGAIKKSGAFKEVEGLVEETLPDLLEIVLYGVKDAVDTAVVALELVAAKKSLSQKKQIEFAVEPYIKNEDYRGVVRFVKKRE